MAPILENSGKYYARYLIALKFYAEHEYGIGF
jgi:hypothetical protein